MIILVFDILMCASDYIRRHQKQEVKMVEGVMAVGILIWFTVGGALILGGAAKLLVIYLEGRA